MVVVVRRETFKVCLLRVRRKRRYRKRQNEKGDMRKEW